MGILGKLSLVLSIWSGASYAEMPTVQLGASAPADGSPWANCVKGNMGKGPNPSWGCEGLSREATPPPAAPPADVPPTESPPTRPPSGDEDEEFDAGMSVDYLLHNYDECVNKLGVKTREIGAEARPLNGKTVQTFCREHFRHGMSSEYTISIVVLFHLRNFEQCQELLSDGIAKAGGKLHLQETTNRKSIEQVCRIYYPEKPVRRTTCHMEDGSGKVMPESAPGTQFWTLMYGAADSDQCARLCAQTGTGCCSFAPGANGNVSRCFFIPGGNCGPNGSNPNGPTKSGACY
jgi:hypothetical protein